MILFKKAKRAITLIELVVSIAVSTIIFVGATALMIYLQNQNKTIKDDVSNFFCANTLMHAIESEVDEYNHSFTYLTGDNYKTQIEDEVIDRLEKVSEFDTILFSTDIDGEKRNYYFVGQHFGYCIVDSPTFDPLTFNEIYFTNSLIKLEFGKISDNMYELKLSYDENFEKEIKIVKQIFKKEG